MSNQDSKTQILWVPGFGSSQTSEAVDEFMALLATTNSDVHYVPLQRLRSYRGTRGAANHPLSLWTMAEGVRQFMREHGIEKARLMGHSMGSPVCLIVATEWPECVEEVVAICPPGLYATKTAKLLWRAFIKGLADYQYAYGWPHAFRAAARRVLISSRQYVGWQPWQLRRCIQEASALTSALTLKLALQADEAGVPVTVVYTGRDLLFNSMLAQAALTQVSLRSLFIPDGVHDLPQLQPNLLFQYLAESGFFQPTPERS